MLDFIERNSGVREHDRAGLGNTTDRFWRVGERRELSLDCKLLKVFRGLNQGCVARPFVPFPPYGQKRYLFVLDAFGFGQSVHPDMFEMVGEQARAWLQPRLRDHENQN